MARYAWNDKHPYFALTSNIVHSREAPAPPAGSGRIPPD